MVTVGEVEAGNVHAGINHLDEHVDFPAGWAKSANDFGSALGNIDGFEDVGEFDSGGIGSVVFGGICHSIYWLNFD